MQVVVHPAGAIAQSPAPPQEVPASPRNLCSSPSEKRASQVAASPRNRRRTPSGERAGQTLRGTLQESWPHGWAHSGNATTVSIDISMVNAKTMRAVTEATLKHLGGKLLSITGDVASLQTFLCSNIAVGLTATPSRAEAFAALGCRIYFRGVQKKAAEPPQSPSVDARDGRLRGRGDPFAPILLTFASVRRKSSSNSICNSTAHNA